MTISAQTVVRAMRGDSHSYLLGTSEGNYFVTKFAGKVGAHRRLINEWIGSQLLSRLGLATPSVSIVEITADFTDANGGKLSATGLDPSSLRGLNFGSEFPGDPAATAVYDYLPDSLLAKVENLGDFVGTMLIDLWCGKATRRQAVFVRSKRNPEAFQALMIDNDDLFGGLAWRIEDAAAPGLHLSLAAYSKLTGIADLTPWLTKIRDIPESFFQGLFASVPHEWGEDDRLALSILLWRLSNRRADLEALALGYIRSNRTLFPSWVEAAPARRGPHTQASCRAQDQQFVAREGGNIHAPAARS
jgi:hypothetical protein